jgi:hypothetical protein
MAYVIDPAEDGHWRKLELVKEMITAHFPNALPEHINYSLLTRTLNANLSDDFRKTYGGNVSRPTVIRAFRALRAANR